MFDNPQEEIFATSELKMEEIIFAACRGGWPATLNLGDDKSKLLIAKEYVKSVYKNDISRSPNKLYGVTSFVLTIQLYSRVSNESLIY